MKPLQPFQGEAHRPFIWPAGQPAALRPLANPTQATLFAAWILSLVLLPIAKYFWGEPAMIWGVTAGVLFQVALVLFVLQQAWGVRHTLQTIAIVVPVALLAEAVGTAAGIPFGVYHYTTKLQPQIAQVPLLIPFAWLMMLPPAWAVARLIAGHRSKLSFVVASAAAMTTWDLFLDPQMVAWGFWVWAEPGGYFGIPWLNFVGWLLTAALITLLVNPKEIPLSPLLAIYVITWLLETIGQLFFWNLPGPALAGFAGMGSMIGLAWLVWKRRKL